MYAQQLHACGLESGTEKGDSMRQKDSVAYIYEMKVYKCRKMHHCNKDSNGANINIYHCNKRLN